MSYWDSSALVKLYVAETDSGLFEQRAAVAAAVPVTSRLAVFEIHTTLWRKESEGSLQSGGAENVHEKLLKDISDGNVRIIEFSSGVEHEFGKTLVRCFKQNPPVLIRTLDAIHRASAIAANEIEFVATDERLRDAAVLLGLTVFP